MDQLARVIPRPPLKRGPSDCQFPPSSHTATRSQAACGVDKADFEFWCLAVSAVNGCAQCLASHEQVLRDAGVSREQVHEGLRTASVLHAVAVTLEAEAVVARVE